MRLWSLLLIALCLAGCQPAPEVPILPPQPEDLSQWVVPELVQPERVKSRAMALKAVRVPAGAAEKVVDYTPGVAVEVPVAPGQPLAVVLEAGEQVRQIVDGDRAPIEQGQGRPWEVKEGGEGSGDGLRPHIFVTVTHPGLTNGLVVTTTKRAYLLTCKSVGRTPVRVLRWYYPQTVAEPTPEEETPGLLPHPEQPMKYHVGYRVESSKNPPPGWFPRSVIDSGTKTYIIFPEITLFESVPLIRLIGPNGPQLVNARQFLNVVILDELVSRLELRVGIGEGAEVVTISRSTLRTISCPDDPACPVWPAAASVLVRRAS